MIYAIGSRQYGFTKFGVSANPAFRLASLQTACPFDLELFACAPWEDHLETRVHELLQQFSIRGEWFKDCEQSQFVIGCIRDNDLDRFIAAYRCHLRALMGITEQQERRIVKRQAERGVWWMGCSAAQESRVRCRDAAESDSEHSGTAKSLILGAG